jgi:four helix bundle protein
MRTRQFRDLLVWQRSMRLAEEIYAVTRTFPKEEMFGLANQLRRAAVSIPSNIAEGQGRETQKSFVLFLTLAQGSLFELETQVELAGNLRMIPPETTATLLQTAAEIGRMLHGLRKAIRSYSAE